MVAHITADNVAAAKDNRQALEGASGELRLPRGTVYTDQYYEIWRSNLYWIGEATIIKSLKGSGLVVDGRVAGHGSYQSNGEVPANIGPNEVGYIFQFTGGLLYRGPSMRFTGVLPEFPRNFTNMIRIKNAWIASDVKKGSRTIKVANANQHFNPGDDCFITDGTWSNELAREWNTVTKATATTLYLKSAMTRDHTQVAVANVMTFPRDNVFESITFDAELQPVVLLEALRNKFKTCKMERNARFGDHAAFVNPINCGYTEFDGCDIAQGLHLGQAYRTKITDCLLAFLTAEEHSTFTEGKDCVVGASGFDPAPSGIKYNGRLDTSNFCHSWTLTDFRFYGRPEGLFIYDDWHLTRCKAFITGDVTVRGRGAILNQFETDGRIAVATGNYEGAPPGAGTGVVLDQCKMNWLWLQSQTKGWVSPDTEYARLTDQTEAGAWNALTPPDGP